MAAATEGSWRQSPPTGPRGRCPRARPARSPQAGSPAFAPQPRPLPAHAAKPALRPGPGPRRRPRPRRARGRRRPSAAPGCACRRHRPRPTSMGEQATERPRRARPTRRWGRGRGWCLHRYHFNTNQLVGQLVSYWSPPEKAALGPVKTGFLGNEAAGEAGRGWFGQEYQSQTKATSRQTRAHPPAPTLPGRPGPLRAPGLRGHRHPLVAERAWQRLSAAARAGRGGAGRGRWCSALRCWSRAAGAPS